MNSAKDTIILPIPPKARPLPSGVVADLKSLAVAESMLVRRTDEASQNAFRLRILRMCNYHGRQMHKKFTVRKCVDAFRVWRTA